MANLPSYDDLMKNSKPVEQKTAELPKYEELMRASKKPSEEDSIFGSHQDLGDLAKSVGQGALLGGGDELLGALQAGKEAITNPEVRNMEDLLKAYRKHQQENEAEYKKVKERSPILSGIGQFGGSLIPAVLTGGTTAELSGAGKIAAMTGLGGVTGGLSSEGTLENNPGQVGKDVLAGGALGAVTQGALNAAGAGLSKLKGSVGPTVSNYIQDSPKLRQLIKSFQEGTEGRGFTGDVNKARLQSELEEGASKLGGDLDKVKQYGQQQYADTLEKAPKITAQSSDDLKSITDAVESLENARGVAGPRNQDAITILNKLKSGEEVPAQDLKELQKYLRDNSFKLNQGTTSDELSSAADTANKLLKEQVPGYAKVNELHGQIQDPINSFIKNVPSDELDIAARPKGATAGTSTYKAAEGALQKSTLPYGAGSKQANQLRLLKEGLQNLQESDPEALKKMGIDNLDEYFKNIRNQSDTQAIGQMIEKGGQLNKDITGLMNKGLSGGYEAANIAGKGTKALTDTLYNAPKEQLSSVAGKLIENPLTAHLGHALNDAVANPASTTKNAVLFSIMQNPDARKQLESISSSVIPGVQKEQ